MVRLLVEVLIDDNGLLAAGLRDPVTGPRLAHGSHAPALVVGFPCAFCFC
jgi:hypothetical protein